MSVSVQRRRTGAVAAEAGSPTDGLACRTSRSDIWNWVLASIAPVIARAADSGKVNDRRWRKAHPELSVALGCLGAACHRAPTRDDGHFHWGRTGEFVEMRRRLAPRCWRSRPVEIVMPWSPQPRGFSRPALRSAGSGVRRVEISHKPGDLGTGAARLRSRGRAARPGPALRAGSAWSLSRSAGLAHARPVEQPEEPRSRDRPRDDAFLLAVEVSRPGEGRWRVGQRRAALDRSASVHPEPFQEALGGLGPRRHLGVVHACSTVAASRRPRRRRSAAARLQPALSRLLAPAGLCLLACMSAPGGGSGRTPGGVGANARLDRGSPDLAAVTIRVRAGSVAAPAERLSAHRRAVSVASAGVDPFIDDLLRPARVAAGKSDRCGREHPAVQHLLQGRARDA